MSSKNKIFFSYFQVLFSPDKIIALHNKNIKLIFEFHV